MEELAEHNQERLENNGSGLEWGDSVGWGLEAVDMLLAYATVPDMLLPWGWTID